jgi:predicted nucleotidyltransferase
MGIMTSMEQIEDFVERVAGEFRPTRVLLFGSFARGEQGADSDVDLLIIMPFTGKPAAKSVEIRLKARPPFPVDLIVRTQQAVEARLAMGDSFIREALEQGMVLYEADHG